MREFLAVAQVSLLKTWKDKLFIVLMIVAALVFTSLSGAFFGGSGGPTTVPVTVTDHDGSALSKRMTEDLEAAGPYSVSVKPEETLYEDVRQGRVDTGFIFPEGFEAAVTSENPLAVKVVSLATSRTGVATSKVMEKSLTSYLLDHAVRSVTEEKASEVGLSGVVDAAAAAEKAQEIVSQNPALTVEVETVARTSSGTGVTWSSGYSAGVYIMFTMFTVLFNAGDILQERKDGTWGRLLTTPATKSSVLGGKMIGSYVIGLIQVLVLFLAGRYLLHINFGANPGAVLFILALTVLVVTGLGLFMSTMVRTTAQLGTLAPIVIVSTCMLGGCYWPLDIVSPLMRTIAKVTPQSWAMNALNDVMLRGKTLTATAPNLAALVAFGVVFFVLGAARVKYE